MLYVFCRYEGQIPAESIGQLVLLSGREGLFQGEHLKYILRLYWLKAYLFLNQGSSEIAIQALHTVRLFIFLWDIPFNCVYAVTQERFQHNCFCLTSQLHATNMAVCSDLT